MSELTLNLVVSDAIKAMKFYEKVFGATRDEVYHFPNRSNSNEANVIVGGVSLRLIDENADFGCSPSKEDETSSIWLEIEVEDAESTLKKASIHGAKVEQELSEFMGTLNAQITDPYGYVWTINQVLKEVTFEERYRFYEELHSEMEEEEEEQEQDD